MGKNNIRSFRYDDDVKNILENFEGSSMNDKFNNLVRFCFCNIEDAKKKINYYNDEIEKRRKVLYNVNDSVIAIESMMSRLNSVKTSIENVSEQAKKIADKDM